MKQVLFLIFTLPALFVQGQNIRQSVNDYVNTYVATSDFSGCIQIIQRDKIIFQNCYGYANASFEVENQPSTKFKIGSVSKQFTAVAILLLEQEGALKTTDTLSKYFPNEPIASKITIEQLLTHTSGVIDIYNVPDFNNLSCGKSSIADLASKLLKTELSFPPGTQYQYSNGAYAILAHLIEQLSKTSFQDYLENQIFVPLQMYHTGHPTRNEVVQNLAVGYDPLHYANIKLTNFLDPELLKGSGSLYSTVQDLQRWIRSIKNRELLSEKSYNKLLQDYGHNYGLGISVYKSFDRKVFGHDGRVNGFIADYLHYEEDDSSIIILGNIQTGVADFFRRDVAAIIFNKEYKSRAKNAIPLTREKKDLNEVIGVYAFGPNFKVHVELIGQALQARANEGSYSELVPLQDGRYFSRTLYSFIEFVNDENGRIAKMIWTNNDGISFEGAKI